MNRGRTVTDYRFKVLYAIAMIMIVCSHCQGGSISFEWNGWFPYGGLHIVLFLFGSGYFYRQEAEKHIAEVIFQKFKKLIVPMYLYNFAYGFLVWASRWKGFTIGENPTVYTMLVAPITNGHQFMYNLAGWFVVPLFMAEVYYLLLRKVLTLLHANMPRYVFFLTGLLSGILGCQLAIMGRNREWWLVLVRMLLFAAFYSFGVFYHEVLEKYDCRIPAFWYFCVIFFLKFLIICRYGKSPDYVLSWCNNFTEGPVIPLLVGMLGSLFWFRIASIVTPVIGENRYLNQIADHTYTIMMNQFLAFMVVKAFFAVIAVTTGVFADFDLAAFQSDIWWLYIPRGIEQFKIWYVAAGITLPILFQLGLNRLWFAGKCLMKKTRIA